jgi:hypothetical protein
VDRGEITPEQATELFESAREAIIQKRKEARNESRIGRNHITRKGESEGLYGTRLI